ncbi:polysaccharide pyruvyl transferase family protein [Vibrio diabolicus]|uniref:polysaccharide pyruvyl transferase family protein n=1 Tax=Vibrio diabolicus TaxID=50719 RepID=UPI0037502832
MKRFGLLSYDFKFKNATNVGDYIQSLAAKQFIPNSVDIEAINREELNKHISDDEIFLIMNGWFSHQPSCWPPAESIKPLFVSFHINSSVKEFFSRSEEILKYLKNYEPIGCRDTSTRDFLVSKGIDAYFSGCLTTTLNRDDWSSLQDRNGVLFIDIYQGKGSLKHLFNRKDINFLEKLLRLPKTIKNRFSCYNADLIEAKLIKALDNQAPKYLTTQHSVNLSEDERYELAKKFLTEYANSELVVTSRIHVALPCLAFGTPVLFVNPGMDTSRFPGLDSFFNMLTVDQIEKMSDSELSNSLKKIKNKEEHVPYRNELKLTCSEAVNNYLNK